MKTCTLPGCDRKHYARGYCQPHYQRAWKNGGPGRDDIGRLPRGLCTVSGCDRPHAARGYCRPHYLRVLRYNDPQVTAPIVEQDGDNPTYGTVHHRLRATHGRAVAYLCAQCPRTADEWSYDHADTRQLVDAANGPYSTDLKHYRPLCRSCHRKLDSNRTRCDLDEMAAALHAEPVR